MKHPEYDSPFELTISNINTQMAKNIDEMCWKAVQQVGINVDKEKLLIILKQDSERYREAYANGYDTGYEKRDDELVRCKDCKHGFPLTDSAYITCGRRFHDGQKHEADWFCADAERRDNDDG